jgi:hypothetical protein
MSTDLNFYTNEELVKELLKRQSFAGIVIWPQQYIEDLENVDPDITFFDMSWNNRLPNSTVKMLMEKAIIQLNTETENDINNPPL